MNTLKRRFRLGNEACKPNNGNTKRKRASRNVKIRIPKLRKKKGCVNHVLTQCLASKEGNYYFVSFRKKPVKHKVFEAQYISFFKEFTNSVGDFFLDPLEKIQADIEAATQSKEKAKTDKTKKKYEDIIDAKLAKFSRLSRKAQSYTRHSRSGVRVALKNISLRVLDCKYDSTYDCYIARCEPKDLILL
jgi:hypothetical protein